MSEGLAQRLEAVADAMEEVERGKYEEMLQTKELRSIAKALKEIAAEMREWRFTKAVLEAAEVARENAGFCAASYRKKYSLNEAADAWWAMEQRLRAMLTPEPGETEEKCACSTPRPATSDPGTCFKCLRPIGWRAPEPGEPE